MAKKTTAAEVALTKELLALNKKIADTNTEQQRAMGEYVSAKEATLKVDQLAAFQAEKITEFLEKGAEAREKQLKDAREQLEIGEQRQTLNEEEQEYHRTFIAHLEKAGELQGDELKKLQDALEITRMVRDEREKEVEKLKESGRQLESNVSSLLSFAGIAGEFNVTVLGKMVGGITNFTKMLGNGEKSFVRMAASAGNFVAENALGTIVRMSEELFVKQDGLIANFKAQTGASDKFSNAIFGASNELRGMGLDITAASDAGAVLYNSVTAFKDATPEAARAAAVHAGVLSELGVNSQDTAESMQQLTLGLGMSIEQAQAAQEEFIAFARELEIGPIQAMADFAKGTVLLASRGEDAIDVLKGLEVQSRATGVATEELISIASKYDTFEGAATHVGRLNGLLGGAYLNSIEMVYAKEDERIQLVKDALVQSGKSFDAMTHHERQAIATAAGIGSVAEAQKIFNGEADSPAAKEAAARQKDLAAQARAMKDIMDRLSNAMQGFAISMKPVIDGLSSFVEWLTKLGAGTKKWITIGLLAFAVTWKITKAYREFKQVSLQIKVAQKALNIEQSKGIFLKLKDLAIGMKTFALKKLNLAMTKLEISWGVRGNMFRKRSILFGLTHIAVKLKDIAVEKMRNLLAAKSIGILAMKAVGYIALAGALGTYTIASGIASAAAGFFNLVMSANPLALIIIAIIAVIAMFGKLKVVMLGIAKIAFKAMMAPTNAAIWMINLLIKGINKLPFVNIPRIPSITLSMIPGFEEGVTNFTGGAAIVGEKGPELVHLAKGTNVESNEKTKTAAKEALGVKGAGSGAIDPAAIAAAVKDGVIAAFDQIAKTSGAAGKAAQRDIVIKLDQREFGRAIKVAMPSAPFHKDEFFGRTET